jgi:flagellar hook-associated protein 3 FlgL
MRVTSRMMVENSIRYMQDNLERLAELQAQTASGKQFTTPSDSPRAALTSLTLRSTLASGETYLNNLHDSADWLAANEQALKDTVSLTTRALTLAKQGQSDTLGAGERLALGVELEGLIESAVQVANSRHRDSFLFAGFQVDSQPFTYTGAGVTANLASTAGPLQRPLEPGQTLTVNVDGNTLFNPVFAALIAARDALNANNPAALPAAIAGLQTALDAVATARSANGARQQQVASTIGRLEQVRLNLRSLLSQNEDANLAEAISLLKQQETAYQAVLSVGARTLPSSLFEFLR